jgi:hypothetical protein
LKDRFWLVFIVVISSTEYHSPFAYFIPNLMWRDSFVHFRSDFLYNMKRRTWYLYMPLVEQELLPFLSTPVFSGVRVAWSLVLCVCFVERCMSFVLFLLASINFPSSTYGFSLPLWYRQTLVVCAIICEHFRK